MEQRPDPTPDEIRQACRSIRAGWTTSELIARRERMPPLQVCDFVGVQAAAEVRLEDRLVRQRDETAGEV